MTFSPSSKDSDVIEEATGDGGKEVVESVEAESGQATARLSTGSCSCERSFSALRKLKTWSELHKI